MRNLFVFLFLLGSFHLFPKASYAFFEMDSLKNVFHELEDLDDVEELLNARLELIQLVRRSDYALYLEFAHENIELAKKHNVNWALVDIYMELGGAFIEKGSYSIALKYLNQAYECALKDEYRPYVGWVTLEIGNCYEAMQHYKRAIDFYKISLDVFKETDESEGIALASTNIGVNYMNLNNLALAEHFLHTGLEERKILDDPVETGYVQMYLANLQMKKNEYDLASQNLTSLIQDVNNRISLNSSGYLFVEGETLIGLAYSLLAQCGGNSGATKEKYNYLFKAGQIFSKLRDSLHLSETLNTIGENFFNDKQYGRAITYADSALQITEGTMILNEQARASKILSEIHSQINDKNLALNYLNKYILIHDSMFNQSVIDAIADVDVMVETLQQVNDNEILQLNIDSEQKLRKTIVLFSLVFLVILLITLVYILLKLRKGNQLNVELTEKNRKIEEQSGKLENLNLELSQLVKSKDKFHSIIAHDLKNPVGSIYNITELLANDYDDYTDSEKRKLSELLYETSKQTLVLLENLLTWSQVQGGHMKLKKSVFNMNIVVERTIENLRYTAELKSIGVHFVLQRGVEVFADQEMISTTIRNLFSNAVKFTQAGKNINIGVQRDAQLVEVWVEDEGIGIPQEQIENLLHIDSSYHRLGTNNENGTGLGLQLSNEFVKMNGGYFKIYSRENVGSRFSFFLPAYNSN